MDEAGNATTKTSRFRYVPNNLIEFNTIKTLAVGMGLKTSDNQPLAYLRTNSIRKKDGSLITGVQTGTLTVRKDAAFAVSMNGVTVVPGFERHKYRLREGGWRPDPHFLGHQRQCRRIQLHDRAAANPVNTTNSCPA